MRFTIVKVIVHGGVMKIISLLGAFAVLCLIIMPTISQPSLKGCACMPGDCHEKPAENCCSKSSR